MDRWRRPLFTTTVRVTLMLRIRAADMNPDDSAQPVNGDQSISQRSRTWTAKVRGQPHLDSLDASTDAPVVRTMREPMAAGVSANGL